MFLINYEDTIFHTAVITLKGGTVERKSISRIFGSRLYKRRGKYLVIGVSSMWMNCSTLDYNAQQSFPDLEWHLSYAETLTNLVV